MPLNIIVVTDTHYFENSLGASGEAYEKRSRTDQKCVAETGAILDAVFEKMARDKEADIIIIPGDLVYRGEAASHVGFIEKLRRLQKSGKKIFVTTARHDYAGDPCGFIGDKTVPVEGMPREKLRETYYDFGFSQAIAEHEETMSYVAQLSDDIRLLAINCDGDCGDFRGLWDDQMQWIKEQIQKAHEDGCYIFAMMHYPLLPGSPIFELIEDAKITDWQKRADELADCGLDLIFTGHMHMQSLTEHVSPSGNKITDICTGSIVGCPSAYRKVRFNENGTAEIVSVKTEDFDWDKGGKTAEEYFIWRFDRMITDIIDGMAYDFTAFTRYFGGPEKNKKIKIPVTIVGRILQKLTIGGVGRMFFFKVDETIKKRLLKDVCVELVRNVFVGDEPYVEGTPMYEAVMKLLSRLGPVVHIVEKKLGAKNGMFRDIPALVASLIGDEKQMDYNAKIKINYKGRS